jgi:hypothetical protein
MRLTRRTSKDLSTRLHLTKKLAATLQGGTCCGIRLIFLHVNDEPLSVTTAELNSTERARFDCHFFSPFFLNSSFAASTTTRMPVNHCDRSLALSQTHVEATSYKSSLTQTSLTSRRQFLITATTHISLTANRQDVFVGSLAAQTRLSRLLRETIISVHFPYEIKMPAAEAGKQLKNKDFLARPAGIEPATPAFGGQYSIH